MTFIDISKQDEPIDPSKFNVIDDAQYPFCLLGFQIRNSYDQLRCTISKKNNPVDVVHFLHYPEFQPIFFRGMHLTVKQPIKELVNKVRSQLNTSYGGIDIQTYNEILTDAGKLTCSSCYSVLRPGVYPIDSECLQEVTDLDIDVQGLYHDIFQNKNVPYFQAISYFTIYILDTFNIANGTNTKALKKIVDAYKNTPR